MRTKQYEVSIYANSVFQYRAVGLMRQQCFNDPLSLWVQYTALAVSFNHTVIKKYSQNSHYGIYS